MLILVLKKILNLFFTNIKCHSKFSLKQDPIRKVWTDLCICWLHAANELWSNSNGRCGIYKLWPEKVFRSYLHLLFVVFRFRYIQYIWAHSRNSWSFASKANNLIPKSIHPQSVMRLNHSPVPVRTRLHAHV